MRLLATTIFAFLTTSCAERPSEADLEFVGGFDSQLHVGMSIEELNVLLKGHGSKLDVWNICLEKHEAQISECNEGYTSISSFPLPTQTLLSRRGDAQYYFAFDPKGGLSTWFYELYYPEQHR